MPLVQAPISFGDLEPPLTTITVEDILGLPKEIPEPDYQTIGKCLASVEKLAIFVGEMKELSDEDRKYLKDLAAELFKLVEKIDLCIGIVEALPDSVPWKQKADEKLVHLANRTEDVAEVCELAVDDEFINLVKDRLQSYLNARSKN
ncbi:MAG: hypothetical protein OXI05_08130 [Bacteroidota bacterium]|nr:hypothetical protein [Bacteroidota bacterium]MXW13974.1 hypothetical protein [Rhodothermaceae bacterium]MDE2645789.1 hypothetical protein [Bacteroidota bacterium]MXW32531.1 hypothetical protein [Rhodothermaceae bacterium]MYC04988.1 hypothetical protein [Rhodothermaceae bacterium]